MATSQASGVIEIRTLTAVQELRDAVELQRTIWGFQDVELLPVRLFVVCTKIGGQIFGAFDGDRMIGFLLAVPGVKLTGDSYLHSHMMGVLPEYRDRGVGRMLKLRQREDAIQRSIDLVEWTFDPLELKNAFFNIERLGAIVRRFVLNQYGTTSSPLHGGLPTDRCIAEWHLKTKWVALTLSGKRPPVRPSARIEIPNNIGELRRSDPLKARDIQQSVSHAFLECLDRGLAVTRFERSAETSAYLLSRWESK